MSLLFALLIGLLIGISASIILGEDANRLWITLFAIIGSVIGGALSALFGGMQGILSLAAFAMSWIVSVVFVIITALLQNIQHHNRL